MYEATQASQREGDGTRAVAEAVARLPEGRVLAPWSYGHAIDVLGKHPVVLDNFGSMPDPAVFEEGSRALLATSEAEVGRWCRAHGVRYVVFADRARIASTAAAIGVTIEPRTTVWWRMMRGRAARFRIVAIAE